MPIKRREIAPLPFRKSTYDPEIVSEICARLANNELNGSFHRILASEPEKYPSKSTFMVWCASYPEVNQMYETARFIQADAMADEILDISDDRADDWSINPDTGEPYPDKEHIQRARLRVDTRKFLMGKYAPRRFGESITTTLQGPGGGAVQFDIAAILADLSSDDRNALRSILARAISQPAGDTEGD